MRNFARGSRQCLTIIHRWPTKRAQNVASEQAEGVCARSSQAKGENVSVCASTGFARALSAAARTKAAN